MPVLIDLSQTMIANIMMSPDVRDIIDENIIKHMIINSLVSYKKKFSPQFGELVICCDSRDGYWRKEIFPHYKAGRKKDREENSFVDWSEIFRVTNQMVIDLKEHFPYKILQIPLCEADDIIGVLALTATSPTLIVGSDKDYYQCHQNPNVKQWSNRNQDYIVCDAPKTELYTKIIKGDKGDGIPNIKSPSDTFITGTRQKSVMAKDLTEIMDIVYFNGEFVHEDKTLVERYNLNKRLIDFTEIPKELQDEIKSVYVNTVPKGSKDTILKYLIANKMRNLMNDLTRF